MTSAVRSDRSYDSAGFFAPAKPSTSTKVRPFVRYPPRTVAGISLAVDIQGAMKILLMSKDRRFCDRTRLAFAREGGAVRIGDRQAVWSRTNGDDDVMLLH